MDGLCHAGGVRVGTPAGYRRKGSIGYTVGEVGNATACNCCGI